MTSYLVALGTPVTSSRSASSLGLQMIQNGLSCLPLGRSKKPITKWAVWQSRLPTPAEVESWRTSAFGLVTGIISRVVVVDCESLTDGAWALTHLAPTPCQARSRRGLHLYYRHPGTRVKNATHVRGRYDVRGDGGFVVAPGTTLNGHRYRWHRGGWDQLKDCPTFDMAWLPPEPETPQAVDHHRALTPLPMRRALGLVAAAKPAVSGQGGHKQTFSIACNLFSLGLSREEVWDLLLLYNARCDPPWNERELLHKLDCAQRAERRPVAERLYG